MLNRFLLLIISCWLFCALFGSSVEVMNPVGEAFAVNDKFGSAINIKNNYSSLYTPSTIRKNVLIDFHLSHLKPADTNGTVPTPSPTSTPIGTSQPSAQPSISSSGWTKVYSLTGVHAVASDSTGMYLVQAVYNVGLYTSANYGVSWSQTYVGGLWTGVAASSSGQYWAAIAYSVLLSQDYGKTWVLPTGSRPPSIYMGGVSSDSSGQYLSIALNNGVYVSSDFGNNWGITSASNISAWSSIASSGSGSNLIAVGQSNHVCTSNDFGQTWVATSLISTSYSWNSVASDYSGANLVAAMYGGLIYVSTNFGTNWTKSGAPNNYWSGISSDSTGQYLAACGSSSLPHLYVSSNFGIGAWTLTSSVVANWYGIASSSNGQYLIASGSVGTYESSSFGLSIYPTLQPSTLPTLTPSGNPTTGPSRVPTVSPSQIPTTSLTLAPSRSPSLTPSSHTPTSAIPTNAPSAVSSAVPTLNPSNGPTLEPSARPPTCEPFSNSPSFTPTNSPVSVFPSTGIISLAPSVAPSLTPSLMPSVSPSGSVSEPTSPPTQTSISCPAFTTSNTNNGTMNTVDCSFISCGGSEIVVSGCNCTGSEYFWLYNTGNDPVYEIPGNFGSCLTVGLSNEVGCVYAGLPANSGNSSECFTYTLQQGCAQSSTCSGTTVISGSTGFIVTSSPSAVPTITPTLTGQTRKPTTTQPISPTPTPTTAIITSVPTTVPVPITITRAPTNTPFTCPPYYSADMNSTKCSFIACGGSVLTISGCGGCIGNQYLTLHSDNKVVSSNYYGCDNCAFITYIVSGSIGTCSVYTLDEGCVGSQICSGIVTISGASSVVIDTPTTSPALAQSTDDTTHNEGIFSGRNSRSFLICIPGIFVLIVKIITLTFRAQLTDCNINTLNTVYAEIFEAIFQAVNLILSFNALAYSYRSPIGISRVLLILSRFAIGTSVLAFVIVFLLPYDSGSRKDTANLSLFLDSKAMTSSMLITFNGCKITEIPMRIICIIVMFAGAFDLTVLRLLPWSRSEFTDQVSGYPNIFTVRCGLYGTLIATFFQTSASIITTATGMASNSTESIVFLVVSLINLLISLLLVVMFIQMAFSGTMKVNIIHFYKKEDDGDLEIQMRSTVRHSESSTTITTIKQQTNESNNNKLTDDEDDIELGTMITGNDNHNNDSIICIDNSSEILSPMADVEIVSPTATVEANIIESVSESQKNEEVEEEVILDERGILFNTSVKHADETLKILREQLIKKGENPLEFIPLADLKFELESLFNNANQGIPYDETRMDYLLVCMDANPEYKAEKEVETKKWREEMSIFSAECLEITKSFIPPSIFSYSVTNFVEDGKYSVELAKRLIAKKCLWLVRVTSDDIERMHIAELQGRFNPQAQGLDIVETAAIHASLPPVFLKDHKKEIWRQSIENQLKMMDKEKKNNKLTKMKQRHPAYKNQVPAYTDRDSMHNMRTISGEDAFKPRTSFENISRMSVAIRDSSVNKDDNDEEDFRNTETNNPLRSSSGVRQSVSERPSEKSTTRGSLADDTRFSEIRNILNNNKRVVSIQKPSTDSSTNEE